MGTVYLAERDEPGLRKTVAIKVVRSGRESVFVVSRFRTESQILAALEHPGIARLYDGGTTDDGRPYFVMEHVDGQDLLSHCDAARLAIEARVRLFVRVCESRPVRPSGAGRAPRPQALEHPRHCGGRGQAARLRHRQVARSRDSADRWRRDRGLVPADDAGLRQPGAGARPAGHHGQRRLLAGRRALRAALGTATVSPAVQHRHRGRAHRARAAARAAVGRGGPRSRRSGAAGHRLAGERERAAWHHPGATEAAAARGPRQHRPEVVAQGALRALRDGGRPGGGSAPAPGGPPGAGPPGRQALSPGQVRAPAPGGRHGGEHRRARPPGRPGDGPVAGARGGAGTATGRGPLPGCPRPRQRGHLRAARRDRGPGRRHGRAQADGHARARVPGPAGQRSARGPVPAARAGRRLPARGPGAGRGRGREPG